MIWQYFIQARIRNRLVKSINVQLIHRGFIFKNIVFPENLPDFIFYFAVPLYFYNRTVNLQRFLRKLELIGKFQIFCILQQFQTQGRTECRMPLQLLGLFLILLLIFRLFFFQMFSLYYMWFLLLFQRTKIADC